MDKLKQIAPVMSFAFTLLACTMVTNTYAQDTQKQKAVKTYYASYETKDWNTLAVVLAEDFTFSSPVGDNHISLATYREKCWPTSQMTKKVALLNMMEQGNQLFLLVEITSTEGKVARNVDLFTFDSSGKIKSHECFFGPGIGYPHSSK
jgi:SnoaL-like protein